MPRVPNPYFAGPPATQPDTFFGREDVLNFVDDTLASLMQNIIVFYGQRRIGKTSILHQIARRSGEDYQAVFFDLQSSVERSAHDLLYGLAREISARLQIPPPNRADFQDDPNAFRAAFLPQVYTHLGDKRLLLLLDEFDALSLEAAPTELDALPFVQALNRIVQSDDKQVIFLFVVGRRMKDLSSQQLQIFRGARDRQITLLDKESTVQLITRPAQDILIYEAAAIERIWSLSSGHPYFTQLICHEIFSRAQRQNISTITIAEVEAVIDDAVDSGQSAMQWFWEEVPPVERFTLYTIGQLTAEWEGVTLDQLITQRNARGVQIPDFELRNLPDQLVDRQILKRDADQRYGLSVELVRRWILRNHSLEEVTTALTRTSAVDEPAQTFFKAGMAAYWTADFDLAIENFSRALNINPDYVEARLWLARARAKKGDLLTAIDEFAYVERFGGRESREARIGLADARTHYGQQLEQDGKIAEAIQEYRRVLELDPHHGEANARLSEIFQQQAVEKLNNEGIDAARPLFEQALQHSVDADLEQKIRDQLDQFSRDQEAANNWDEAERAGRLSAELMSRAEDSQQALLRIQLSHGRWHLNQHAIEAAAEIYRSILEEIPGDTSRHMIENDILRYSQQQEGQQQWPYADAALTLLVELFPDELEHRERLVNNLCRQAEFYLDQNELAKAKSTYQRALASAPVLETLRHSIRTGFQAYRRARADQNTLAARKSVEEAMLVLIDLFGRGDTLAYQWLAEARSRFGDALHAEGRLAEAQAVYEQAIDDVTHVLQFADEPEQAFQQRAELWLKLGRVDLDEARFDQALDNFKQALVETSANPELIAQLKTALNKYRHQQETLLRWNQAERALEMLERLVPGDEDTNFWLAETRAAQANWHLRRAMPELDTARRLARSALLDINLPYTKREVIAATLKEAFQAHRLHQERATPPNWTQAEQAMNSVVSLLPDDEELHRWLAETRASQADWHLNYKIQSPVEARRYLLKAAEVCRRALNDLPGDEILMAHIKQSFRSYQQRQRQATPPAWSLAEQAMQILTELLPQDREARQWLAETFLDQGTWLLQREPVDPAEGKTHLAKAKQAYEEALQIDIVDKSILEAPIQAHFSAYRQQRTQADPPQWELATEAVKILAELLPDSTETYHQQAELYAAQGDWLLKQEAVDLAATTETYRQALEQLPQPTELLAARLQENFRTYRLKQQQANPPNWEAAEEAVTVLAMLLPDDETQWQRADLYAEWANWFLQRDTTDVTEAEANLAEADRLYRRALDALSGDKSALIAQIKEDFNLYHLNQTRAEPPRWLLAEKAMILLAALPFEDDEASRRLAEARAAWARACLEEESDTLAQAEEKLVQAEKIYYRALTELPGDQTFLFNLMKQNLNAYRLRYEQMTPPRWSLAGRALRILTELLPEDEVVQGWLVEAYLAQGSYYEDEAQAISGWRRETQQLEKLDEAEHIYRLAVTAARHRTELAPNNPAAWQQLAESQRRLGRICALSEDEAEALAAYDGAIVSWRQVRDMGSDDPFRTDIAQTYVARGDLRLLRGDIMAAGQDYMTASQLTEGDRPWLDEVDRQLQTYEARQKSLGLQKQVVEVEALRYQLQPDKPQVWREYAAELVAYGGQFLADGEFDLACQQYERGMRRRPSDPQLDEEHGRLSRIISQDMIIFIQRQERANNRRQAEEARVWLASADFLAQGTNVVPSPPKAKPWFRRWSVAAMVAIVALLCTSGGLVFGAEPFNNIITWFVPPTETPPPSATLTPIDTSVASVPPLATETSTPTETPKPPTPTSEPPTATLLPPSPTGTSTAVPPTSKPEPTDTDTPPPTPTPAPTSTSTLVPGLELIGPAEGVVFQGASPLPRLEWEPIEPLAEDDYYLVELNFVENGRPTGSTWRLKEPFWDIPPEFFHRADPPDREIQWTVALAHIPPGTPNNESQMVINPTEPRSFTWQPLPLPEGAGLDVVVNPDDPLQILVALKETGIYKSDNGGIDWRKVSNERTIQVLHMAPANPSVVYAGAFNSIQKSEDEGETWRSLSIPPRVQVYELATDPDRADLVFAATGRGILRSSDGGQSWATLDRAGSTGKQVLNSPIYAITAVTTSQGNQVFAAGEGNQIYSRSTGDLGSFWDVHVCEVCVPPIFELIIDPTDTGKFLVGSNKGGLISGSLAGGDWKRTTIPPSLPELKFSKLTVDPADSQIIYAGSGSNLHPFDGEGLYRSLDGGQSWQRFNTWTSDPGPGTYIQGIAVTSDAIFIAGSEGVFRSDDEGDSWIKQ